MYKTRKVAINFSMMTNSARSLVVEMKYSMQLQWYEYLIEGRRMEGG
jgi:hypothetical protein